MATAENRELVSVDITRVSYQYPVIVRSYSDGTSDVAPELHADKAEDIVFRTFSIAQESPKQTFPGYNAKIECITSYSTCFYVALKNKPTSTTAVAQMPTTGAPTGLSDAGLLAVAVGLAGVTIALKRRHGTI